MGENRKIRVGITHGDINGVGYEVILKAFSDLTMLDLCTPVVYGSPKVMTYHRKAMDIQTNFSIVNSAEEAVGDKLFVVNCCGEEETKVDFSKATPEAGKLALAALDQAIKDCQDGIIDVLVTTAINKATVSLPEVDYPSQMEYISAAIGEDARKALTILVAGGLRIALATQNVPLREVTQSVTKETVCSRIQQLHSTLRSDFIVSNPRIAVLSLNPAGEFGAEESEVIAPAIEEMYKSGIQCFGPYAASDFFGGARYEYFDAVLAMYQDQGTAPFRAIALEGGLSFAASMPFVLTSPSHDVEYPIAGKGVADETSLRNAIYTAIDVFRNREVSEEAAQNPLRKQYFEKRDDSDKLKLIPQEK